jgi:tetratricopeptide (TPR) repeat protein
MSYLSEIKVGRRACTKWVALFSAFCTIYAAMALEHEPVHAQSQAMARDNAYLPIEPETLERELRKADQDPVRLYDLVRRADHQGLSEVAYEKLNKMRREQPKNAVAIAAYCFAYQVAAGRYDNPGRKNHPFTEADAVEYSSQLQQAMQLNPKLWLPYAVAGHQLIAMPGETEKALKLLQKAESLAPDVSYTHILLAESYTVGDTPHTSYLKAAKECEIARRLKPACAYNADILFDIYDRRLPNWEKAADAKRYLLATISPDFKLSPAFKARLAKY